MKNFATAEEFYAFCVEYGACESGLEGITGKTLADWWGSTERGDWMIWLIDYGVWNLTEAQWDEYYRAMEPSLRLPQRDFYRSVANAIRSIIGNPFREEKVA